MAALAGLKTAAWPWRGPVGIVEEDASAKRSKCTSWTTGACSAPRSSEAEVGELLEGAARPRFDLDHYRILARHLAAGRAKVVELSGTDRAGPALMHLELVVPGAVPGAGAPPPGPRWKCCSRAAAAGPPGGASLEDWFVPGVRPANGRDRSVPPARSPRSRTAWSRARARWLRADPVHLRADRDQRAPVPEPGVSVSRRRKPRPGGRAEPAACRKIHAARGARRTNGACGSTGPDARRSERRPPVELAGRSIDPHLPPKRWHALLTEIQMALYEHAVNTARERAAIR